MTGFDLLAEPLKKWVWRQGWESLRPVQENAIPEVLAADRDVIISAPTAGGKTEAAFLPALTRVAESPAKPGYAILALSPLKALINDQAVRLASMASAVGLDVTPWHGDIDQNRKHRSLDNPNGILLITPESLESLFVNRPHKLEKAFAHLQYVVVDELHAFIGSERGVQIASLLARLERLVGRKVPRIGVSATFSDLPAVQGWLRPGHEMPCAFPDAGKGGHQLRVLLKEYISTEESNAGEAIAKDIFEKLRGDNNLVFTNARKEAETLTLRLRDMSEEQGVPNEFHVHHGSLSKLERETVEHNLKDGHHPVTAVCTTTLELGIDIGKVHSIAQMDVANSVSGLRQRLGRSGRRGEPSVLRIYSKDEKRQDYKYLLRTNLVQNIAVLELLRAGAYERPPEQAPHFSTLVQQTLSLTAQYGGFYPADAFGLLCREGPFRNVTSLEYMELLRAMGSRQLLTQNGPQLNIGIAGERLVGKMDFYTAFVTLRDFNVVNKATGKTVGSIQYKPYVGEYFLLGGMRWLVETIDDKNATVYVSQVATTGKLMFEGYGAEVDGIIARKMRDIYMDDTVYPYLDRSLGSDRELDQARAAFRDMGLGRKDLVEMEGDSRLFTWEGMKVNRTLSLLLSRFRDNLPACDPFSIEEVTSRDLDQLRANPVDCPEDLAALMPRHKKENNKYDYLLPDALLDRDYAASWLDLEGAYRVLGI